jgi:hypothetical protein
MNPMKPLLLADFRVSQRFPGLLKIPRKPWCHAKQTTYCTTPWFIPIKYGENPISGLPHKKKTYMHHKSNNSPESSTFGVLNPHRKNVCSKSHEILIQTAWNPYTIGQSQVLTHEITLDSQISEKIQQYSHKSTIKTIYEVLGSPKFSCMHH